VSGSCESAAVVAASRPSPSGGDAEPLSGAIVGGGADGKEGGQVHASDPPKWSRDVRPVLTVRGAPVLFPQEGGRDPACDA